MKLYKFIAGCFLVSILFAGSAFGLGDDPDPSWEVGERDNNYGNSVGAPLDGGLLAILAAAGVTYFVSRKKKKNIKE